MPTQQRKPRPTPRQRARAVVRWLRSQWYMGDHARRYDEYLVVEIAKQIFNAERSFVPKPRKAPPTNVLTGSALEHTKSFQRGWDSCSEHFHLDYHLIHKSDLKRVMSKASKNTNSQWRRLLTKLEVKP